MSGKVKRGRRIMDPEERERFAAERREQERERITQAVEELASSEGWARWMEARSRFHNYSLTNTLLIASQCPHATRVAGYRTWQSMGRQVRKGEQAIRIMAPMRFKVQQGEAPAPTPTLSTGGTVGQLVARNRKSLEEGGGNEYTTRIGFRSVSVFDYSQTDGEPLPELDIESVDGDSLRWALADLVAFAEKIDYTVAFEPVPGGAHGYCNPKEKAIAVESTDAPNSQVKTLVHELAHALGVDYTDYERGEAEAIVESVAMIVCGSLGLDTSGYSVPYIAGWCDGDPSALREHAAKVDELASRLERACGLKDETREAVTA